MEKRKSIIIIGAGISGLSIGCYSQINGFQSVIYEAHNLPGGVCTTWNRGDFLFDHCLHWVLGSNKNNSLYPLFEELGVTASIEFHYPERFRKIEAEGRTLIVYSNLNQFETELLSKFPDEKKTIKKFIKQVRFYTKFNPPMDSDFGNFSFIDILKMLPYMPSFMKLKKTTIENYLSKFKNPILREMLFQMFPVKNMPAFMVVMPLAYFNNKQGGYPLGGSLNLSRSIEKKYISLGGSIQYQQKIKKIIVENHKAIGVETEQGEKIFADIIISACDGRTTLYDMLNGKYLTPFIEKMYNNPSLWPPLINISLGINRDLSNEVSLNNFKLDKPVQICNQTIEWMSFTHYCQDPAFAPKGKSVLETQIETNFEFWKELYKNKENYNAEKQKILNIYLNELEKRLPNIKDQIEVIDIATPMTWERYTHNWQASYEGWLPTRELFGKFLPKEIPGLQNFYMSGQWTSPGGGVPMCMSQGRRLVKLICKKEQKEFISKSFS